MRALISADILKKRSHRLPASVLYAAVVVALLSICLACTRIDRISTTPAQHNERSLSRLTELAGPPDRPGNISSPAAAAAAAQPIPAPSVPPEATQTAAPSAATAVAATVQGSANPATPAPASLPANTAQTAVPNPTSAIENPAAAQPLSLYFVADSADTLLPGEEEKLAVFVQKLIQTGSGIRRLNLLGYAADTGNEAGEKSISSQRAVYLASRMQQAGLPADIVISARGLGAARLSAQLTADQAAASRRVDIITE